MQRPSILSRLWTIARTHLVALALVWVLVAAFVEVYTEGTGPMPQQPFDGLLIERNRVDLSWNKGTREATLKLQVAIDDPEFNNPILDKETKSTFHAITDLKPGRTYYWRLVSDGIPGPSACFKTSTHAANF